ncbi:MAG: VOC family protein [Longimicrobiales bacterium]
MGKPVVHWEINARDASRLENFYHELFDWSVRSDAPIRFRHSIDTGSDEGIPGSLASSGGSWPSGALFYVQVDDVKQYLRRVEELGGSTLLPPTEVEGERTIGIFRDPEGVTVGLVQR